MGKPISVFPVDRSRRWIIAPGVASTRQVQVRNDSPEPVELHLKTEEPAAASVSPLDLSLSPRQSRNVDVIFLADWSPEKDKRLLVSVRDAQGNVILNFTQELIAADTFPGYVGLRTERTPIPRRAISASTRGLLAIAVIALIIAAIFFVRMQGPDGTHVAFSVSPVPLVSFASHVKSNARHAPRPIPKQLASAAPAVAGPAIALAPAASHPGAHASAHTAAAAVAGTHKLGDVQPHAAPSVDRSIAVVALAEPEVAYASNGRAVAIRWYVQAQDHALVHLLNERSKIIAQSSISGSRSHAVVKLPRGYHGGVSVEVIAIGYHGERVVQSASLGPPGG